MPVAPPRPNLKKDERKEDEVNISPVAAPLDPALDIPPEQRIRRREKKQKDAVRDAEILAELRAICTDADPTKLYRSMIKVGQG